MIEQDSEILQNYKSIDTYKQRPIKSVNAI